MVFWDMGKLALFWMLQGKKGPIFFYFSEVSCVKQENFLQSALEVARNKLQLSAARAGHCNRASAQHPCGIRVTSPNALQQNLFLGFSAEEMLPLWYQDRSSHYAACWKLSLLLIQLLKQEMGSVGHRGAMCSMGSRQLSVLSAPKRKVAFKSWQCCLAISKGLGGRDWHEGICFVWGGRISCLSPLIIICLLPSLSLSFPFLPFLLQCLPSLAASSSSSAQYSLTAALEGRNNLKQPCSLQKSLPHEKGH